MAVTYKFKADGTGYARGLNQMRSQTQKFSSKVSGLLKGAFAFAGITGLKSVLDNMVQLTRHAERLGIGVEMLQKLSYAAKQAGVDSDRLSDAMKDLNVKVQDGAMNGGNFAEVIGRMGLDIQAMARLSPDKQFLMFSDAIKEAGGNLSRFSADEFGDAMFEVLPILEKGSEGILQMSDDLDTFSESAGRAATKVQQELDSTTSQVTAKLSSWLVNILVGLKAMVAAATQAFTEIADRAHDLGNIIEGALTVDITQIKTSWKSLVDGAEGAGARIKKAMDGVLDVNPSGVGLSDGGGVGGGGVGGSSDKNKKLLDEIAKEQERRAQMDMSNEEKLQSLIAKRKQLHGEIFDIEMSAMEVAEQKTKEAIKSGKIMQADQHEYMQASEQSILADSQTRRLELEKEAQITRTKIKQAEEAMRKSMPDEVENFFAGIDEEQQAIEEAIEAMPGEVDKFFKELDEGGKKLAEETATDTGPNLITSQLASIGGGGGSAAFSSDPLLSENKRQSGILADILSTLGGTEEGGNTTNPEL